MLTIRSEQIVSIEASMRERFHQSLASLYRDEFNKEIAHLTEVELLEEIAVGHERSQQFGIVSERGVARYVGLRLLTKPAFDEQEAVIAFLKRSDIEPTKKMDIIFENVIEALDHPNNG